MMDVHPTQTPPKCINNCKCFSESWSLTQGEYAYNLLRNRFANRPSFLLSVFLVNVSFTASCHFTDTDSGSWCVHVPGSTCLVRSCA